ncbi:MAG: type 1 glutamine amidotransferase [Methanoregula sp.]|nr:type 1 glutamine amidotransferase [Methanoregula sp.]
MDKLHLIVFQHTPEEPMGYFETICREWNIPFDYVRLFETNEVPNINATHVLILGGPMSVNDTRTYPYLADEKMWTRSFVKSGIPVLGICLGAQLIANAFGGKVSACEEEVGWHEIRRIGTGIIKDVPSTFRAFQMHSEAFDIPINGRILCEGHTVRNQAFDIGSATGLQFHFEITADLVQNWIRHLPLAKRDEISHDTDVFLANSHSWCRAVAERFFKKKSGKNRIGKEN